MRKKCEEHAMTTITTNEIKWKASRENYVRDVIEKCRV